MSPPAQNALSPSPRISTARSFGSSAQARRRECNSPIISKVRALSALGRFSVRIATPLRISQSTSVSLMGLFRSGVGPVGCTLLQKGVHAFLLVRTVEQIHEAFALQGERRAARGTVARLVYQALRQGHGAWTERGGPLRQLQGRLERLAARHDLFDQADAQSGLGIEPFVGENHALGPALADQPG